VAGKDLVVWGSGISRGGEIGGLEPGRKPGVV